MALFFNYFKVRGGVSPPLTLYKDYGFLEVLEKGLIPVISDQKLSSSAAALAPKGFHGICDWHTIQRALLRSSDVTIKEFDKNSDKKRKVFILLKNAHRIKRFNTILRR